MLYELSRRLSKFHELAVYSLSNADHSFGDLRAFTQDYQIHPFSTTPLLKSPFGRLNQLMRLRDLGKLQKVEEKIGAEIDQQNFDLIWVQPCQIQNSPSILQHIQKTPTLSIESVLYAPFFWKISLQMKNISIQIHARGSG